MRTRTKASRRFGLIMLVAGIAALFMSGSEANAIQSLAYVVGDAMETAKLCGMRTEGLDLACFAFLAKQNKNKADWLDSRGKRMNVADNIFRPIDDCPKARAEARQLEMTLLAIQDTSTSLPGTVSIKKGEEIAHACFQKSNRVSDQHFCIADAISRARQNDFVYIGFTYLIFVIDGEAEELTRDNS